MNRIVLVLCLSLITPLFHSSQPAGSAAPGHSRSRAGDPYRICNQDGSLCVKPALAHSLIQNPMHFEVRVRCPETVDLEWELRDASGKLLDEDSDNRLDYLVSRTSAAERTIGVSDFAIAPAKSNRGVLTVHGIAYSQNDNERHELPALSIPVRLDLRKTTVTFATPASSAFADAVTDSVEAPPGQSVPMKEEVQWKTATLLYVRPAMMGGAAAEAASRDCGGQGPWHVIRYSETAGTAHITIIGDGWAGVTYYLTGLDFLLQKTAKHRVGVQRVVFDPHPDYAE